MSAGLIEEVRKYVEEECKKESSKFGYEIYDAHFVPMAENARKLAEKLNADVELVEIAAWLHDIGSVIYGRENHHITGAKIAEEKLKALKYPEERIELVKKCIINHRGSVSGKRETIEEQIIADADGMAAFDRIEGLFSVALVVEKQSQKNARISVKKKLANSFDKLSPEAQKIILRKYEAAMLLLR